MEFDKTDNILVQMEISKYGVFVSLSLFSLKNKTNKQHIDRIVVTTIIFSSVGLYYKYSYSSNYVFIQIHYCVRYLMYTYPMKKICCFFVYVFVKQLRKINTNVGNHQNITFHLKSLDMSHPCISHLTICSIYHYYYYYYLFILLLLLLLLLLSLIMMMIVVVIMMMIVMMMMIIIIYQSAIRVVYRQDGVIHKFVRKIMALSFLPA